MATLVAVYLGVHLAIRLLAPDTVEHDEAEQLVLGQTLALGYGLRPRCTPGSSTARSAVSG